MLAQHLHDRPRVRAVPVHAHRERLHAAQHEVAVERRRHRAHRVLQEPHLVGELGVVDRDEPADDVGVTAEVLRGRVHRRRRRRARAAAAGTASRTCCRRRRVRRARARTSATAAMSTIDERGLVGDSIHTSRVSSRHAASSAARSRRSTRGPRDAVPLVHARDEPERAAVRVGRDDHVIARIERAQDRVLGRETAREREPVPRALERRDARLERGRASGCRCARTRSPRACRPPPARTSSRG